MVDEEHTARDTLKTAGLAHKFRSLAAEHTSHENFNAARDNHSSKSYLDILVGNTAHFAKFSVTRAGYNTP